MSQEVDGLFIDKTSAERSLGRIEGLLVSLNTALLNHFSEDVRNFAKLDQRVSGVEKKVWMVSGGASVLGLLAGYFLKGLH